MAATRPLVAPPGAASGGEDLAPRARALPRGLDSDLAAVLAVTLVGAVVRVLVARQSIFADELSTYWISARHSLGGALSLLYSTGRIKHAEITPPLSFLASWVSTRAGTSPILLRLPALIAGTATIPLVYVLGRRCVGRHAALLASVLTALSPFMIYYSAEARAYGLMMFLVVASTLVMLLAADTGRTRYWVAYAVLGAAAFCTHYTSAFVLVVQLGWLLWTRPGLRRPALLATAGAALLVVPWIPGLIADTRSPTVKILSAISAFTAGAVRVDLEHWALGYPYTIAGGVRDLPGLPALLLLAVAFLVAAAGIVAAARGAYREKLSGWRRQPRLVLIVILMVATPIGEILVSATGHHIIGVRDMAASWPYLALAASAFLFAAGSRLGLAAAALVLAAFLFAVPKMLGTRFSRPDYRSAAAYVSEQARPGDAVIDETGVLSPGPLTGFDVAYHGHLPVFRALTRAERDHPFTLGDPVATIPDAFSRATRAAREGRIFVVSSVAVNAADRPNPVTPSTLPGGFTRGLQRRYPGFILTVVTVYSRSS